MYKRRIGVGAGLISYATLLAGRGGGGNGPPTGLPTLILNFVGYTDPNTGLPGSTFDADFLGVPTTADQRFLGLNFAAETYEIGEPFVANPTYTTYIPDPSQPQSGITSYYVWE